MPPVAPGVLWINVNQIDLPDSVFDGSFRLRNDGGSPLDWGWQGSDRISLSQTSGTLTPGQAVVVTFTVDHTKLLTGEFFANCVVYSLGGTHPLLITGKKEVTVNPGIKLPNPQIKPNE